MLARLLHWYASTDAPAVVRSRDFVRGHRALRSWAHAAILLARNPLREIGRRLRPPIDSKLRAFMDARQVGGALSIADLERVWQAGQDSKRASCIAAPPECEQIGIVLRAANPSIEISSIVADRPELGTADLIVAVPSPGNAGLIGEIQRRRGDSQHVLLVGDAAKRADQYGVTIAAWPQPAADKVSPREKLARGDPLHVVMLNDVGFQFGAGIAQRRQAASFLRKGWKVSVVSWAPVERAPAPAITGVTALDRNYGVHSRPKSDDVVSTIRSLAPDFVLFGNLHGADWPMSMISRLRESGTQLVAYMHDCHWVTGRCAYMGPCNKFLSGCDATCPTADEYPRLARDRIAGAWQARADLFAGPQAIPLIANSQWTRNVARQRFGDAARTDVVHLGLDHDLFAPLSKFVARALLDLPQDKTIVVIGAREIRDRWKGGPLFHALHDALIDRDDIAVVIVGDASERLASTRSFGRVEDERLMPFILNAADLFVSAAVEEAFGQMLLEASSCAVPVIAYDVGGVRDIVVPEETGLLVARQTADDLMAAVNRLAGDRVLRERLGRNGRARVERQFTLAHQADAWVACLQRLFG
jgi:glycosyltransferase involved in cell wall biosynthesis